MVDTSNSRCRILLIQCRGTHHTLLVGQHQAWHHGRVAHSSSYRALALTQSIYGFASMASYKTVRHNTNTAAKIVTVLLPVIMISLLQAPAVKRSLMAFLVIANVISSYRANMESKGSLR